MATSDIALTTLGVKVCYCLTDPTIATSSQKADLVWIKDIKSTPELNPETEALDATTLRETEFKKYAQGLKDLGGSLEFTSNYTEELETTWATFYLATTGASTKKDGYIVIVHPDLENASVIPCRPQKLGLPEMGTNAILEAKPRVTPTGEISRVTKENMDIPTEETQG